MSNDKLEALRRVQAQLDEGYLNISDINDEAEIDIIKRSISTLISVEQFRWERDCAIKQLNDLGVCFGENIDNYVCLQKQVYDELIEYKYMYEDLRR